MSGQKDAFLHDRYLFRLSTPECITQIVKLPQIRIFANLLLIHLATRISTKQHSSYETLAGESRTGVLKRS